MLYGKSALGGRHGSATIGQRTRATGNRRGAAMGAGCRSAAASRAGACACGGACPRCVQTSEDAAGRPGAGRCGGDAPVPLHPLSDAERALDLQSDALSGDEVLQKAFDNDPPLRLFDRGEAVRKLQQAFIDMGFGMPRSTRADGTPDGIFGAETLAVVKGFQWRQGIVRDGIVGRQTLGEMDGLLSGQTATGTGPSGPQRAGEAIYVRETEVEAPQKGRCGGFVWRVDWDTNARNGYLVQEITHTVDITGCGAPSTDWPSTPHYWEAWRVQQDGGIHGTSGADDDWINPSLDGSKPLEGFPGTRGRWRTTGRVYFVNQLDPAADFKIANVPDAGSLWSTTTRPGNLGTVLLERAAGDAWNCCTRGGPEAPLPESPGES